MQSDFDRYRKIAPADVSDAELSEGILIGHYLRGARENLGLKVNFLGLTPKGDDARNMDFRDKIKRPKGPTLWMVSDIIAKNTSGGPESFHRKSLLKWRSTLQAVLINEGDRNLMCYQIAVANALLTGSVVALVETTERHGSDWAHFFESHASVLIATPDMEHPIQ